MEKSPAVPAPLLITVVNVLSALKGFGRYEPRPFAPSVAVVSQLKVNGAMINLPYFRTVLKPNIPYEQVPMFGEMTCGFKLSITLKKV